MLNLGLISKGGPKYSLLKNEDKENANEEVGSYEPIDILEAFEISDRKDSIEDPSGEYARLRRVAVGISWFSVIFGFLTGVAAIVLGQIFGSEALFGYGLDAVLDSLSSVAVLWRFYSSCSADAAESKERKACIVISFFFFASSLSLMYKSLRSYEKGNVKDDVDTTSRLISDIFSATCGLVTLCCGFVKVYYGKKLQSKSLLTDSIITFVGAFMSIMSVMSLELHKYDDRIWYLDAASGLVCAAFLLIFGMKIITQLTCFYGPSDLSHKPIKEGK